MSFIQLCIFLIPNVDIYFQAPTKTSDDPTLDERVDYVEQLSRTKILRTCHELMMHGVDKNDFYLVDPDGELIGQLPILVYCDFHSGTTEVIHNSEEMVKVERCLGLGCFKHDIQYGVPMSQINALIELSHTCTQSINFGCFLAPLAVEGTQVGSWIDKIGRQNNLSLFFVRHLFITRRMLRYAYRALRGFIENLSKKN
jgi:hypothetical protein